MRYQARCSTLKDDPIAKLLAFGAVAMALCALAVIVASASGCSA